jgi:hypothetical protein
MPPDTESFTLRYHYERHHESAGSGGFISRQEINIIDLGLIASNGVQVGASGADKSEITVSERYATPGYQPCTLTAGEWQILVGAYKVAPEGLNVVYELDFSPKHTRLLKGDLHVHTLASDGVLTAEELAQRAARHGLDFLAITDHNQMVAQAALPRLPGITLIPGIEWTHYQGHANFLGAEKPYDAPFYTNTLEEVQARFHSARERGAVIVINHPFDENCGFHFDLNALPFDLLEIWNGPMRESNLRAVGLWQSLLAAGKKVPVCGGSDYHRDQLFLFPGGPTTCVLADSTSPADILRGLRLGHAYVTFAPNGPELEMSAGEAGMGDGVTFPQTSLFQFKASGLLAGDVVQVVTGRGRSTAWKAETDGNLLGEYRMEEPGFARIEILRGFLPGLPLLPALIANPIYFNLAI